MGKLWESETYSSLVHGRCLVPAALQPPLLATKSGPWTWNTYLARDRVLTACASKFCLSVIWQLASCTSCTAVSVPWGEKEESLCYSHDGYRPAALHGRLEGFAGHGGTSLQYWAWSDTVSSTAWLLFSIVTPVPRYSEQKCLAFYFWWQATDATCLTICEYWMNGKIWMSS